MALNKLCTAFRQITVGRQSNVVGRYISYYLSEKQRNILPLYSSKNAVFIKYPETNISFVPKTLNIDFANADGALNKNKIEIPFKNILSIEEPLTQYPIRRDLPLIDKSLELPSSSNVGKFAVNLIVIRRHKMKKHQRKKLRKKMQYVWAKIRQMRNIRKEKNFQAELIAKIKEAQAFDAKAYVSERLALLRKERIQKTYRGEILPPAMIKQFLEEEQARKEKRRNKFRLTLD
ncbi:uncharacterized protein LOC122402265 [Colletes gigas]|uniref:uncharacterized protein LOC122402265 n=1 Tax=Colletes gigas TaxID=935657 RepID=UPI001C9AA14C|nr:uncharacterized protein LOC122402265 [Colletes gigas]